MPQIPTAASVTTNEGVALRSTAVSSGSGVHHETAHVYERGTHTEILRSDASVVSSDRNASNSATQREYQDVYNSGTAAIVRNLAQYEGVHTSTVAAAEVRGYASQATTDVREEQHAYEGPTATSHTKIESTYERPGVNENLNIYEGPDGGQVATRQDSGNRHNSTNEPFGNSSNIGVEHTYEQVQDIGAHQLYNSPVPHADSVYEDIQSAGDVSHQQFINGGNTQQHRYCSTGQILN